jgi:hypothetical protein
VEESELSSQVRNTLSQLGVIQAQGPQVDPVAELLEARYGVVTAKSWLALLGGEYTHALGVLRQAEATFLSGPSYWLAHQNSFNQIIFLALQSHLGRIGTSGVVSTRETNGSLRDYGVTLDPNSQFSKTYPTIADCFREMNRRRNQLPLAHAYEKKSANPNQYLRASERNRFIGQLRKAYIECIRIMA